MPTNGFSFIFLCLPCCLLLTLYKYNCPEGLFPSHLKIENGLSIGFIQPAVAPWWSRGYDLFNLLSTLELEKGPGSLWTATAGCSSPTHHKEHFDKEDSNRACPIRDAFATTKWRGIKWDDVLFI